MTNEQENQVMDILVEMCEKPDLSFRPTIEQEIERDAKRAWAREMCYSDN